MANIVVYGNELYHFGILGQKWGERRWQNEDGSLTPEGREHYGYGERRAKAKEQYIKSRDAYKRQKRTNFTTLSGVAGRDYKTMSDKQNKATNSAYSKMALDRAKYKASSKENKDKYDKKEFNSLVKEMKKTGLSGSVKDMQTGGKGTSLYDAIAKEKGKEYAKKVEDKTLSSINKELIVYGAAMAATFAAEMYMLYK